MGWLFPPFLLYMLSLLSPGGSHIKVYTVHGHDIDLIIKTGHRKGSFSVKCQSSHFSNISSCVSAGDLTSRTEKDAPLIKQWWSNGHTVRHEVRDYRNTSGCLFIRCLIQVAWWWWGCVHVSQLKRLPLLSPCLWKYTEDVDPPSSKSMCMRTLRWANFFQVLWICLENNDNSLF